MGTVKSCKIIFFFLIMMTPSLCLAQFGPIRCSKVFEENKLVKEEFIMDFQDTQSLKILETIVDVFYQFPKSYIQKGEQFETILNIPESKWMEIFKRPFEEVVDQLQQVEIYKVSTFANGLETRSYQRQLISAYGIRVIELVNYNNGIRQTRDSEPQLYLLMDRRIFDVMDYILEPSQIMRIFETGLIRRIDYQRSSFSF